MALTDSELADKIDDAIEAALLGKDVMFEGQRITMENLDSLFRIRERLQKRVSAAAGNGMAKNNVGLKKRL